MPRPDWNFDVSSDSESIESSYDSDEPHYYDDDDIQTVLDYEEDNESDNMPMVHKKYYIGCYTHEVYDNILLFVRKIHLNTFFHFPGGMISEYLYWYSVLYLGKIPTLEIMQLIELPDGIYSAVIKTFWIKIIQRAWKKKYKELKEYISYRKGLSTIRKLENGIRIRPRPPGLRGMLANYA